MTNEIRWTKIAGKLKIKKLSVNFGVSATANLSCSIDYI